MKIQKLKCPKCNAPMVIRETKKYKYRSGQYRKFWGCSNFPDCKATHGAHPDGEPMGIPGTDEEKLLRKIAHRLADKIWGDWEKQECNRELMYAWLHFNSESGHISKMQKKELKEIITKMEQLVTTE